MASLMRKLYGVCVNESLGDMQQLDATNSLTCCIHRAHLNHDATIMEIEPAVRECDLLVGSNNDPDDGGISMVTANQ